MLRGAVLRAKKWLTAVISRCGTEINSLAVLLDYEEGGKLGTVKVKVLPSPKLLTTTISPW